MCSESILDNSMIDIQTDFLLDDSKIIGTFYPRYFKSFLLCAVLGHEDYQVEQQEFQKARDILDKVCDILRISIIIFGTGLVNLKKNQIVFGIDDSMLGIQNKDYEDMISSANKIMPKSVLQTKFK